MTTARTALGVVAAVVALPLLAVPVAALVRTHDDTSPPTGPAATWAQMRDAAGPAPAVPADLDLTAGWPATNGSDGSPVTTEREPGVADLVPCGETAWSRTAPLPVVDLAGASYTGEAEDLRGRALALYADTGTAAAALRAIRATYEACPEERIGGTDQVYEVVGGGAASLAVTHRYRGEAGFDTGLEVVRVERVGPVLYLAFAYGEGGGSPASIRAAVARVGEESAPVLRDLCVFAARGC